MRVAQSFCIYNYLIYRYGQYQKYNFIIRRIVKDLPHCKQGHFVLFGLRKLHRIGLRFGKKKRLLSSELVDEKFQNI